MGAGGGFDGQFGLLAVYVVLGRWDVLGVSDYAVDWTRRLFIFYFLLGFGVNNF